MSLSPQSRRTTARRRYSLRLLLGWAASLVVLIVAVRAPLSGSGDWVGWSTLPTGERIALTQLSTESPSQKEGSSSQRIPAPQPTLQASSESEAPAGPGAGESDGEGEAATDESPDTTSARQIYSIAALGVKGERPRLRGGPGALGLHIQYPPEARRQGIEGRLILNFTVDPEGYAQDISVVESLHPLCDSAAVDALQSVRFHPGTRDGEVVPVRMSLPVRFQLETGGPPRAADTGTAGGS